MEKEIENIITSLLSGEKLTTTEQDFFNHWMEVEKNRATYYRLRQIRAAIYASKTAAGVDAQESWRQLNKKVASRKRFVRFLPYAAAVMIAGFGLAIMTLTNKTDVPAQATTKVLPAIAGQKQVILTLSNGRQVTLSDNMPSLEEQNGTILQSSGEQLTYQSKDSGNLLVYNSVQVPRGGEYKLILSDGSIVWLNSESEITYPVSFSRQSREIRLKGEAFFEVREDRSRPFIVRTEQFDIRVTGTRFNIRTYPNDIPSATLAQGKIQLEKEGDITCLVPGQQASVKNGQVNVEAVDLEEAIAWRNEAFYIKHRSLESLLNDIARWYDIEIFYQNDNARNYHFSAWFRRSTPLNKIIEILGKTQKVKLELKGKTLIVKAN